VSSGFPFFIHAVPELVKVVDFMLILAAFVTAFFGWMTEAIASGNIPIVAAPKKMHNKACQPMSASRLLGRGKIVIGAHGCTFAFARK
jgi:hypothetical protein